MTRRCPLGSTMLSAPPFAPIGSGEELTAPSIRGNIPAGSAVAIQVTYHPGWHATANGKGIPVRRDGLGLMWLDLPVRDRAKFSWNTAAAGSCACAAGFRPLLC